MTAEDIAAEHIVHDSNTNESEMTSNNVSLVTESTQNEEANKKKLLVQNDNQNQNAKDNNENNAGVNLNIAIDTGFSSNYRYKLIQVSIRFISHCSNA